MSTPTPGHLPAIRPSDEVLREVLRQTDMVCVLLDRLIVYPVSINPSSVQRVIDLLRAATDRLEGAP